MLETTTPAPLPRVPRKKKFQKPSQQEPFKVTNAMPDVITVELWWRERMPYAPVPHQKFVLSWRRHYSLTQIFGAINLVADFLWRRKISRNLPVDLESVGKFVSNQLRKAHGTDDDPAVRTLHFSA